MAEIRGQVNEIVLKIETRCSFTNEIKKIKEVLLQILYELPVFDSIANQIQGIFGEY